MRLRIINTQTIHLKQNLIKNNISGYYLGEALVIINGSHNECLGSKGTIEDNDAITATFTIMVLMEKMILKHIKV